jgi:hypothetical protein
MWRLLFFSHWRVSENAAIKQRRLSLLKGSHMPGPSQEMQMFPVPIGVSAEEAPVQYTELVNPTEVDLRYEVNMTTMDKLKRKNHDFPVLFLDNPKGLIPARSKGLLKVGPLNWPCDSRL